MKKTVQPQHQGLYDPWQQRASCGVGFMANMSGQKSHDIVSQSLDILVNLDHRGGCGCEPNTGDGAGILMQIPDGFLRKTLTPLGMQLPPLTRYGVGMIFMSKDNEEREQGP